MPPVRTSQGRASKACEACRARKTRCYECGASRACLRCTTFGIPCSLQEVNPSSTLASDLDHRSLLVEKNHASCAERISRLESTVDRLSSIVARLQEPPSPALIDPSISVQHDFQETRQELAPLAVIQDAAQGTRLVNGVSDREVACRVDIVLKGIITEPEAEKLLDVFRTHYGRWIGMDESQHSPTNLGSIKSPLLLCACCLIAVRHSSLESASAIASILFLEAKSLLGDNLMQTQQSMDFFQAILVLSLWSTTLGQSLQSIDGWLLTGVALQHASASDIFRIKPPKGSDGFDDPVYNRTLSVYNHLCLAHLHSCVSMRRKSMVTQSDVARARLILQKDSATNFEVRMVAELHLYFTIYEQCVVNEVNLPRAKQALHAWKSEFSFLFDQPRRQFLQTSFFFAGLLIYEQSLSSKSAVVRESLVSDMVRLASDILRLLMDSADERTKHLTDHVYHVFTFAAVTLCRLTCRYEQQLSTKIDLNVTDELVSSAIRWLNTIDTVPHISQIIGYYLRHTLTLDLLGSRSRLISNVQTRLRPRLEEQAAQGQSGTEAEDTFREADVVTAMPDFLGMEDYFDFDWDAIIPDWQSLDSAEFGNDILSPL